jgi:hypothetical protein
MLLGVIGSLENLNLSVPEKVTQEQLLSSFADKREAANAFGS